jgi:uncharacterized protein
MDETTARDRNDLEVLSYDECLRLLGSRTVGRVAFVDAGTPIIVPVNYLLDGASVVIRSAPGSKLDTADRARPLAFEIDDHDPSTRTGWSVLLTGIADPVDDEEAISYDRKLDAWALGDRQDVALLRLQADSVTGRRIDTPPPPRG